VSVSSVCQQCLSAVHCCCSEPTDQTVLLQAVSVSSVCQQHIAVALNQLSGPSCCRQCLFLGVNAVTRGLESASVGCVLLAQDADPKLLVSHIPTMCGVQGVPVLIMPSLRSIVSTALGFSCLALGVKVRKPLMWCVMAAPLGDTP
jgi:ribosomal protein L7Ae-like RNA K-turn-binding protein